ncbi:hypothetical protein CDAR_424151 [Caerostris darwini]|uniref:Uncharacterized protein n=1 Tax=Caerostris darwini TaxID=1538125 RepID=A0AAV4T487_9ARAC|nr:hypothetical protein CDAR_424151 [Caerostris darwini]
MNVAPCFNARINVRTAVELSDLPCVSTTPVAPRGKLLQTIVEGWTKGVKRISGVTKKPSIPLRFAVHLEEWPSFLMCTGSFHPATNKSRREAGFVSVTKGKGYRVVWETAAAAIWEKEVNNCIFVIEKSFSDHGKMNNHSPSNISIVIKGRIYVYYFLQNRN